MLNQQMFASNSAEQLALTSPQHAGPQMASVPGICDGEAVLGWEMRDGLAQ